MTVKERKEIYEQQVSGEEICRSILNDIEENLKFNISEFELYQIAKKIIKDHPKVQGIWHPIIIKFDQSTLATGIKHIPSKTIFYNEIAIIDIGIIVDGLELDYGQTYGKTKEARQLISVTDKVFDRFKGIVVNKKITPQVAYRNLCAIAEEYGVKQIADHAGHLLGSYPTQKSHVKIGIEFDQVECIPCGSWMLEVHLSDSYIGCFKERLVFVE